MINYPQKVADALLKVEAIKLNTAHPFKWVSGWNSPIYCDNRLTLSSPRVRRLITNGLVELIRANFPNVESIAGVATSGIPQAALVAERLKLPMLYVRSSAKEHGMKNLIEGKIISGQKVIVIEDLISTGGSSLKAVNELKKSGFNVLGVAAIFTYGIDLAEDNFKQKNIKLITLTTFDVMLDEALKLRIIKKEDLGTLKEWKKDPSNWTSNYT